MDSGPTELFLDDLTLGPIVKRTTETPLQLAGQERTVTAPLAEIRGDRLLVAGRPFFPRMVPYHGEPVDLLSDLQVNPIWIPNFADTSLLKELQSRDLYAMATPSARILS